MPKYTLYLMLLGGLLGCTSPTDSSEEKKEIWKPFLQKDKQFIRAPKPLELSLILSDKQLTLNGSLSLTLQVKNTGSDSIVVSIGGGSNFKNYDFVVTRMDSTMVWHRLTAPTPMAKIPYFLAPGEITIFKHTWNLKNDSGNQVTKGSYYVFGGFPGLSIYSASVMLESNKIFSGPVATEMQKVVIE